MIASAEGFALLAAVVMLTVISATALILGQQNTALRATAAAGSENLHLENGLKSAFAHAQWELNMKACGNYAGSSGSLNATNYDFAFSATSGSPLNVTLSSTLGSTTRQSGKSSVRSFGSAALETATSTAHAFLEEDSTDHNHGGENKLVVSNVSGARHHALIVLDLSGIPSGAMVERAELDLMVTKSGGVSSTVEALRLTQNWGEGDVTWDRRFPQFAPWTDAGGTTSPAVYAAAVIDAAALTLDLTDMVRDWHAGMANHGLLLRLAGTDEPEIEFGSDAGDIVLRVYYRCECGESCALDLTVSCDARQRPNQLRSEHASALSAHTGIASIKENVDVAGIAFGSDGGYILANDQSALHAYATDGTFLGSCDLGLDQDIVGLSFATGGDKPGHLVVLEGAASPRLSFVGETCAVSATHTLAASTVASPTGIAHITQNAGGRWADHVLLADQSGDIDVFSNALDLVTTITDASATAIGGLAHVPNQELILVGDEDRARLIDFDGNPVDEYDLTRFAQDRPGGVAVDLVDCDHRFADSASANVSAIYETALSIDPIAHWRLDESSGTTAFDSVGGHHGTLVSGPAWTPTGGAVQGALGFRPGEHVEVSDQDTLDLAEEFSISAWFFQSDASGFQLILSKGFGSTQNYWLGVSDGYPAFFYHDGAFTPIYTSALATPGQWHHLVATYSTTSGALRMYLNGTSIFSGAATGTVTTSAAPLYLARSDSGGTYDGLLDDVRLFAGALTAADVTLLYNEGDTVDLSGAPASLSCSTENFRDQFDARSFSGSDGSLSWTDPWIEVGESNGASSGDVQVRTARYMRIRDNDNGGEGIERDLSLAGYSSATLTYDYARFGMGTSASVGVYWIDPDDNATRLAQIDMSGGAPDDDPNNMLSSTHDLAGFLGTDGTLRFITSSDMPNQGGIYLDNVNVEVCP